MDKELIRLAREAGTKIMEIYSRESFEGIVDFKADDSPLTLADKESHKIIAAGLQSLYPTIPLISEEGKDIPYDTRKNWDTFWLVDPLDGTKEFIKRNGQFTVNIALIKNKRPVLGLIYIPVSQLMYFGEVGKGAIRQTGDGVPEKIFTAGNKEEIVVVGSSSHASPQEEQVLSKYKVKSKRTMGSSIKFCLVAEGSADLYYRHGPTMEWDTAAGQAILEAAGGTMVDGEGNPFTYNKTSLLNGNFLCTGF